MMAYQKTVWKNREVERPRTYNVQENDDGTITLIPAEGVIIEAGTPITAQTMNNIEDGIEALDNTVTSHLAENATDNVHGLAHKGALLMISSAQEFAPNQLITVRWDYADYDTDNFYSSSTPTRITVPEGLNFAKFTVNLRLVNDKVDSVLLTITKNGSPFNGRFDVRHNIGDGTRSTIQGSTPFIPVDKGDYFEVNFRHQSSSSVAVDIAENSASWFSIEAKI